MNDRKPQHDLEAAVRLALGSRADPPSISDPAAFLKLADRHGVTALIAAAPALRVALPGDLHAELDARAREAAAVSLRQVAELARLIALMHERQIPVVCFKGPSLSQAAFGDAARRSSTDLDLMTPRDRVADAIGVLHDAGYVAPGVMADRFGAQLQAGREFGAVGPEGDIVEVQWAFAPPQDAIGLLPAMMRREWATVAGTRLPTFMPADLLVGIGVHAAREGWWRLIWIADAAGLMARRDLDWDRVVELSERAGTARITRITIMLAQRILSATTPGYLRRWLSGDDAVGPLVDRILAAPASPETTRVGATLIGLHDRRRDDVRSIARWVVSPTPADVRAVRLPRAAAPLYALVRPLRLATERLRRDRR